MKRLVIELEDNMHQQLKEIAVKQRTTMRDIVLMLLEKWGKGNVKNNQSKNER